MYRIWTQARIHIPQFTVTVVDRHLKVIVSMIQYLGNLNYICFSYFFIEIFVLNKSIFHKKIKFHDTNMGKDRKKKNIIY